MTILGTTSGHRRLHNRHWQTGGVRMRNAVAQLAAALLMLAGCGTPASNQTGRSDAPPSAGLKRIVMAFPREMDLRHDLPQGRQVVRPLVNPGLSVIDDQGVR